jgi:iron complex transport system ATP-binding protein
LEAERQDGLMGSPYLELEAIEAWLGPRPVFRDLHLRLDLGEHTVVLGPNGSGKSSLIRLLCRELYPVVKPGSSVRIFGTETVNLWQLRRRIGLLSCDLEGRHQPGLLGRDVVLGGWFGSVGLGPHLHPTDAQRQGVMQLMADLALDHLAERRFGELSTGERRRLLLARALVHQPDVLVLDEPTNGLDLRSRHRLLGLLRQLAAGGTTLLLVTHQIEAIVPEISRVLLLRQGRLVGDGAPLALLQDQPLSDLFDTPLQVVEQGGWRQVLPG